MWDFRFSNDRSSRGPAAVVGALLGLMASHAGAQTPGIPSYPEQAALSEYMMDRSAEIALARSAAPGFISSEATIYVLTPHGYEIAVKGSNGFTCFVDRSWSKAFQDPDFWNPNMRGPTCLNSRALPVLAITEKITQWSLAGHSKAQIEAETKAAVERKEFPAIEPGAMSYMMSRNQYLAAPPAGRLANWKPHVMFYFPSAVPETWGVAGPPAAVPVYANTVLVVAQMPQDFMVVMVPVSRWSDETPAPSPSAPSTHNH